MFKQIVSAALLCCCWFCCALARAEASLTAQETRWLRTAGPVLAFSQRLQLPIDIMVQPTAGPDDVPMAIGFDGTRCRRRRRPHARAGAKKASPTWWRWPGRSATIRSTMRG